MNKLLAQNSRAILIGGVIMAVLALMLSRQSFTLLSPAYVSAPVLNLLHLLAFLACWWLLVYLINKFPLSQILGVFSLLLAVTVVESITHTPFNPITLPLLILFWLGVAYFILPEFFKKYRMAILSVYGLVIGYFFVFRNSPTYMEEHHLNFLRFVVIPVPVFAALWGYEQWRWLKTLQADKAKTELALLKNQINPHFFFNTLNNLYGLAVEKSDQAPAMILKLSDMMRYTIYEGKADFVPLENEVTYLEDYIDLHRIRYHKQVDIRLQQDLAHAHQIAPLLLVVLLENAFKHGVESLAENAFVDIAIHTSPTQISFQISNNYEPNRKEEGGIGLMNLKQRLALIYPQRHRLEIAQTADTYTVNLDIEPHEVPDH